jgi:hypothetical protein
MSDTNVNATNASNITTKGVGKITGVSLAATLMAMTLWVYTYYAPLANAVFTGRVTVNGLPFKVFASNNAALSTIPYGLFSAVTRQGWDALGDSPPVDYIPSNASCPLNGGAGDGGSQIPINSPTPYAGCMLLAGVHNPFDARIFGALCNGTGNTGAIVQAIDTYLTSKSGGDISLPTGNCPWGSTYTASSNVSIGGQGPGATLISSSMTSGDIISLGNSSTITRRNRIHDLGVICTVIPTGGAVFHVNGASDAVLENLQVGQQQIANSGCFDAYDVDNYGNQAAARLIKLAAYNGAGTGSNIGSGSPTYAPAEVFVDDLTISTYNVGLLVASTAALYGSKISVFNSVAIGCEFNAGTAAGQQIFDVTIDKLDCDSSGADNIWFGGTGNINEIILTDLLSSSGVNGLSFNGTNKIDGVVIRGPKITLNSHHGAVVQNPNMVNFQFDGGMYCNNSTASSGTYHGLIVATANTKFQLGNFMSGLCGSAEELSRPDNQGYGFVIGASANDYQVYNVRTPSNVTGSYNGPAASTTRTYTNILNY